MKVVIQATVYSGNETPNSSLKTVQKNPHPHNNS